MGTLVFYPWLRLKKEYSFGYYRLIPYKRGKLPAGAGSETQKQIDKVTKPYVLAPGEPIVEATLLQIGNGGVVGDLSEAERESAFEFSELLAVSGLSCRDFFRWDYWNKDNFRVVIQGFTDHEFVSFKSRRKDGSSTQGWTIKSYQVLKPEHVDVNCSPNIDADLLNSLLKARTLPEWVDYWGAIVYYNLSNTDNIEIDQRVEVVLAIGAFESLLSTRGTGEALGDRFEEILKPMTDLPMNSCAQLSDTTRFKKSVTVRHIWVRDFYNLRSKLAHGELGHKYPAIWSTRNHLLLASHAFPLVLKCLLGKQGIYQLTDEDRLRSNVFEKLACKDHFGQVKNHSVPDEYPWNQVIQEEREEDVKRRMVETLSKMRMQKSDEENPEV